MPEWQIDFKEYLQRLDFGTKEFKHELCLPQISEINQILPLRDLKNINSLIPISSDLLLYLVRRIKTLDGQLPFENAKIAIVKLDSRCLKIGQKFVYRENYQQLLEDLPGIFSHFAISSGLEDLGAYFVFGQDSRSMPSLACYTPPMVEKHGSDSIIMDGIHRNFITKQTGATPTSLLIENAGVRFPCAARDWSKIQVIPIAQKPKDLHERFFSLKKELFRDLKYLGIDG